MRILKLVKIWLQCKKKGGGEQVKGCIERLPFLIRIKFSIFCWYFMGNCQLILLFTKRRIIRQHNVTMKIYASLKKNYEDFFFFTFWESLYKQQWMNYKFWLTSVRKLISWLVCEANIGLPCQLIIISFYICTSLTWITAIQNY